MCLLGAGIAAAAQESLARARDLYLSAAYDEALALLDGLQNQSAGEAATEVQQYRFFCLLALERSDEAKKAVETLVAADPFYKPSDAQASPRLRAVFLDTRKALLPGLVQRRYADAKVAFEKKDPQAAKQFDLVLALLDDPDLKLTPALTDLRTVVTGFRDLARAAAALAAATPPPAPAPAVAPAVAAAPPPAAPASGSTASNAPGSRNSRPAPRPSSAAPAARPDVVSAPVPIYQPMPPWAPASLSDKAMTFTGRLVVTIDTRGNVASAEIQKSIHPQYDQELLAAAKTWRFKPATRNGVPTEYEKIVDIQLKPIR